MQYKNANRESERECMIGHMTDHIIDKLPQRGALVNGDF